MRGVVGLDNKRKTQGQTGGFPYQSADGIGCNTTEGYQSIPYQTGKDVSSVSYFGNEVCLRIGPKHHRSLEGDTDLDVVHWSLSRLNWLSFILSITPGRRSSFLMEKRLFSVDLWGDGSDDDDNDDGGGGGRV